MDELAEFFMIFQVLMESFDRLLEFVKRSKAISPMVAFETANALQVIYKYIELTGYYTQYWTNSILFILSR